MFNRNNFIAAVMAAGAIFIPVFTLPGKAMAQDTLDIDLCFTIANNTGEVWSFYEKNTDITISQLVEALEAASYGGINYKEESLLKSIVTLMQLMADGHVTPEDLVTELKKSCIIYFAPASYG